ncbi:alpha-2-macroglobulin family protein [Flaviaesturariibacter terrae]
MKRLLLLLLLAAGSLSNVHAQSKIWYDAQWARVDSLVNGAGRPQAALRITDTVYAAARRQGNEAQLLRAIYYRGTLRSQSRENNTAASIRELDSEAASLKAVPAAVVHAMIARQYNDYLVANLWRIRQRGEVTTDTSSDIGTWSVRRLLAAAENEYRLALQPKAALQAQRTDTWAPLLLRGTEPRLRPTLYDLLAHLALEFYANSSFNNALPGRDYKLDAPWLFAPAPVFIRSVPDSSNRPELQSVRLYQELTRLHLRRGDSMALDAVEAERLLFAYDQYDGADKDSLYVQALRARIGGEGARPNAAARYLLALWYRGRADGYQPLKDTTWRFANQAALDLLQPLLSDSARSPFYWAQASNLVLQIRQPSLEVRVEKVNLPGAPFRVLLDWRNLQQVYFKIIPVEDSLSFMLARSEDWKRFFARKQVAGWAQSLPDTRDAQLHSSELKADALPVGRYLLLASSTPEFSPTESYVAGTFFYVSGLAYLQQENELIVLNRSTGRPVADANIQLYFVQYRSSNGRMMRNSLGSAVSNAQGRARLPFQANGYGPYQLDIRHGNDHLFLSDQTDVFYKPWSPPAVAQPTASNVYLFTDRSIYRPGQTVYVKGLVVDQNEVTRLVPNSTSWLILRDVNGKEQGKLQVTTNTFGSFQASFVLPAGGLTGSFTLSTEGWNGYAQVSVEEYKRPKFEVRFDSLRQAYRVGDSVRSSGRAVAYASNPLGSVPVRYRVTRSTIIPYFYYWRWPVNEPAVEIAHGETSTDADGQFAIRFLARPATGIDSASNPSFEYRVYVDVTDANGETHSSLQLIRAGYRSLFLEANLPERLPVDSFRLIPLSLTNANGERSPGRIEARISTVKAEERLLRPRLWEEPDLHLLPRDSFVRWFPNDPYASEAQPASWPLSGEKLRWADSLRENALLLPTGTKLPPGFYELELITADSEGRTVRERRRFELTAPGHSNRPQYFTVTPSTTSTEPGVPVRVTLQSATGLSVYQMLQRRGTGARITQSLTSLELSAPGTTVELPVTEGDRGGLRADYITVRDNRVFRETIPVDVPWSNKMLRVSLATFRDKALPGSREQWQLTVRGPKGEQVAAEMLASMYDASLDQLKPHSWPVPAVWTNNNFPERVTSDGGFSSSQPHTLYRELVQKTIPDITSDRFLFDENYQYYSNALQGRISGLNVSANGQRRMRMATAMPAAQAGFDMAEAAEVDKVMENRSFKYTTAKTDTASAEPAAPGGAIVPRRNFNETVFFYPQLQTDSSGAIRFSFTLPEALTRWKFNALAHSQDLAFGTASASIITQKDLMVQPNLPRFLRQGDHLQIATKVVNTSGKEMTGQVQLELFDAATGTAVDGWFQNVFPNQYFTVDANSSEAVTFPVEVPYLYNSALTWRITARSGDFSDAEENTLPVLSSKILVTETLPLPMRGNGSKSFTFEKLLQSGSSETLQQQGLTLEYTANPAWYAVQTLPYLMEYPYECTEQTWNRYYAHALAAFVLQKAPRIKAVFERWQHFDTAALQSNLEKNQELKSALLEETPWVLAATSESQRKKNIALLFDLSKLAAGQQRAVEKLQRLQQDDGSFPWFAGGPSDRYITEYIISGIGHLQELGVPVDAVLPIRERALLYTDQQLRRDYEQLRASKADLKKVTPNGLQVLHLYARSFTRNRPGDANRAAFDYYLGRLDKAWLTMSKRLQGMTALALSRYGSKKVPGDILQSLRETAVHNEELGMYWKNVGFGRSWYWADAPIETQALLIEAFAEIGRDTATVNELRTWLIKNKQTNSWSTTTGTADACYALLLRGSDWLTSTPRVLLQAGSVQVSSDTASEAGSGYFRKTVPGNLVRPEMGHISVQVQGDSSRSGAPSWGAVYWQYFEEMDKVTAAATPLSIERKIFREVVTDKGPELHALESPASLHVGDKVRVRLLLRSDRPMEYVHLKDLRPSCLEPVDVLSGYHWKDGLGYYQSTRDLSTNFFIHYLPRGTYVFEYTLFVTHKGDFSAGLASIQCMYAPEFSAHSEGQRVSVE